MASTIEFTVQLPTPGAFEHALLSCLADFLSASLTRAVPGIRSGVAMAIETAMHASPEYQDLLAGKMWHIMGLENPGPVLQSIVEAIKAGIVIENHGVKAYGSGISGGLTIKIVRADYSDLLSMPEATFTSMNTKGVATEVPWLSWLLQEGENLIVADYTYLGIPAQDYSRTGLGIMVKSKRGWRVPTEFSGTPENNWILRAFQTLDEPVADAIVSELQKVIN